MIEVSTESAQRMATRVDGNDDAVQVCASVTEHGERSGAASHQIRRDRISQLPSTALSASVAPSSDGASAATEGKAAFGPFLPVTKVSYPASEITYACGADL